VIDLRLLGFAMRIPLASMRTLFRYLWLGFWINAVSGVMLLAASVPRKLKTQLIAYALEEHSWKSPWEFRMACEPTTRHVDQSTLTRRRNC